jgi:signal transduction histidine kinase
VNPRRSFRLAFACWLASVLMTVFGLVYSATHVLPPSQAGQHTPGAGIVAIVLIGGFATVGALLAWKLPTNPIGWLMSAIGLTFASAMLVVTLAYFPATGNLTNWFGWIWLFGLGLIPFIVLLFPTGTLPSRRWRVAVWIGAFGEAVWVIGNAFAPTIVTDTPNAPPNPIGVPAPAGQVFDIAALLGLFSILIAGVLALVSLVLRYRRADAVEREQLKWLLYTVAVIALAVLAQPVISGLVSSPTTATNLQNIVTIASIALVPIAIGIAVFRYRLYDIDLVISRTVVFTVLAAFITIVYVGVVVGIGAVFGSRGGKPNPALSIAATAVVALGFGAVRERVRRFANRLVFGRRATPYEALSAFSSRLGGTVASDELLPTMARTLAEGTGASQATVWLRSGGDLHAAATHPPGPEPAPVAVTGEAPSVPGAALTLPVSEGGELLGALSLAKPAGERLTPMENALAQDLASQAALVLRNVRLTQEVLDRMAEVRASRQRIVSTQDAERRRLERNIHDGAQQELVAMAVRLRIAKLMLGRDPGAAADVLRDVEGSAKDAARTLRELAAGIYPSRLAQEGLPGALADQAARAAIPTTVEAGDIGRYAPDREAAVYFCVLEALQNAAKYSRASHATVTLATSDGDLTFTVRDDGVGFDAAAATPGTGVQGMMDRLAALGGDVEISSAPGRGTTVTGRLPVRERMPEPV